MELNNKEILISKDTLLTDIQDAFNTLYPYLKIEFIQAETEKPLSRLSPNTTIAVKQAINISSPTKINFHSNRSVSDITNEFSALGLPVAVFRKSGKVWNVISVTNGWSLESQNEAGEFISTEMAVAAAK
jgi:hypothetical protein